MQLFRRKKSKQPEESLEEIAERSVVRQEIVETRIPPPDLVPEPRELSPKLRELESHRWSGSRRDIHQ